MPNTLIHSKWDSGELVFHDADDYGVGAEILRISQDSVDIGTSTNDVTIVAYGDVTLYGDLDLADEDISVAQGKFIYLEGQDSTTYIVAGAVGYMDLEAATAIRPGIDLLTDRWQSSVTHTLIGMGVAGAGNLTAGNTNCTGFGYNALNAVTSGDHNTAVGASAMALNTTGVSNAALGRSALAANTTGHYNVAVGSQALQTNTTGAGNTAVGFYALAVNTTGGANTAVGFQALGANTTGGTQNSALGYNALNANTTGDHNVAVGHNALLLNTTGVGNIGIGQGAGDNITSADYCIIIGYALDSPDATTDAQLKIGATTAAMGYILGDNAGDMTINAVTGKLVQLAIAGTDEVTVSGAALYPATDNGQTLGILNTNEWSDLFLADGGVIGWNNNDVTITHSSGYLELNGGHFRFKDSMALFFGDSDDVRVQWAGGVLSFMPITDDTGMITFGTGGRQMDVRFYGATAGAYCDWDNSTSRWVYTSTHSHFQDGCHLYQGTSNDIDMYWTGSGGWRIKYANHDTLNCEIGANSLNIDWKWWMGASGYVLFDVGNLAVTLSSMDMQIAGLSNKLYFGTTAAGAYIWASTVNGRMDLVAPNGIYVNNHFRMVANYNLYLGNVDTAYFLNDTPGHMKGYGTQITFTTTLVNATALMLDAGTGGGGAAVRGYLRLWVTGSVGDTKGQIWYDSVTNKIHFWDGTQEREVTSG